MKIESKEEYLKQFTNGKQNEALKYALDTRKFEINLYWKRATYFWAFIAASFAGYFALMTATEKDNTSILIVCILGFVLSYSWFFVNRGSKFWQTNWEYHVDYLEDKTIGPLFRLVKDDSECRFLNPISDYPISVSRVNQLLSFIISLGWLVLTYHSFEVLYPSLCWCWIILIEAAFFTVFTIIIYFFTKSKLRSKKKYRFILRDEL